VLGNGFERQMGRSLLHRVTTKGPMRPWKAYRKRLQAGEVHYDGDAEAFRMR